jgi:hypothetical protein
MSKKPQAITPEEVGQLMVIHSAISHLIASTSNDELKARLEVSFDGLPSSELHGLAWPPKDRAQGPLRVSKDRAP